MSARELSAALRQANTGFGSRSRFVGGRSSMSDAERFRRAEMRTEFQRRTFSGSRGGTRQFAA